jgi:hypothetical protein
MIKERYIVTQYGNTPCVILSDYRYWAEHYTDLYEWSTNFPGSILEGMVLQLPSVEAVLLFKLTWT